MLPCWAGLLALQVHWPWHMVTKFECVGRCCERAHVPQHAAHSAAGRCTFIIVLALVESSEAVMLAGIAWLIHTYCLLICCSRLHVIMMTEGCPGSFHTMSGPALHETHLFALCMLAHNCNVTAMNVQQATFTQYPSYICTTTAHTTSRR